MNIKIGLYAVVVSLGLSACMSTEQKQQLVTSRSHATCYGMGYNQGTDAYNRCMSLASVHFSQQVEKADAQRRAEYFDRLGAGLQEAGASMQAAGASTSMNCTTTGPYSMRQTTCW